MQVHNSAIIREILISLLSTDSTRKKQQRYRHINSTIKQLDLTEFIVYSAQEDTLILFKYRWNETYASPKNKC